MLLKEVRQSLKIAIPVSISQLSHMMVGIADTVMTGNLGIVPLSAATLATSVFYPILMLGIGTTYGQTPLVAHYHGMGVGLGLKKLFGRMLVVNILIGLLLPILMIISFPLLFVTNQPENVIFESQQYYVILALSMFPIMVFQTVKQFAEGLSKSNEATLISLGANVLNVVLNFVLVRPFGLMGIALATLISRSLMAIVMVYWFAKQKEFGKYWNYGMDYFLRMRYESGKIISMLKVSTPVSIQMVMESGAFAFAAFMVGWIGVNEIGAHQIALNIAATAYMIATGIGAAATVRVGNGFGAKNLPQVKHAIIANLILVLLYNSITAALFLAFGQEICLLYIRDVEVTQIATSLLVIAAFFQISDGLQVVLAGALRGIGDVKIPALTVILAYWVLGLPVGYYLSFYLNLGANGIWYGLLFGLTLISIGLFVRLKVKYSAFAKSVESENRINRTLSTDNENLKMHTF